MICIVMRALDWKVRERDTVNFVHTEDSVENVQTTAAYQF